MINTSGNHIVNFWEERYVPDISTLSSKEKSLDFSRLIELSSTQNRAKTVAEIERLLRIQCDFAGIKSNILFSYIPNVVNLSDTQKLSQHIQLIYHKALGVYKQQPPLSVPTPFSEVERQSLGTIDISSNFFKHWVMPAVGLKTTKQLSTELQPLFEQLRQQHLLADDPRAIGFVSTQFHFSTTFVFNHLKLPEQVLLSPYFKFVEEQACIPWQRVCRAAAKHTPDSPSLNLVQKLLPASQEIALNIHHRAARLYPDHCSRRGNLNHPGVKASSIRDLEMFQAYLWLSLLENSLAVVEEELLPLCTMVFPSIDVKWELVQQIMPLLVEEFQTRVEPEQMSILLPYTQGIEKLFSKTEMKVV
ncbi:hypothetical protein [Lyngbya aestuarii]|uniref:hypothetical protein n=1 Tax=Lyngbya aestuarii TaxID=118322 RepID=UPI00403DD8AF